MFEDAVLLMGRILLAWIFLHEGVFLATHLEAASRSAAQLGVPAPLLIATVVLQLAAGVAIAIGWYSRIGSAALALFCLATALMFHADWASRNELLHFEKDLAIAGGMLVLLVRGAGRWSVDGIWQVRRA